MTTGARAAMTGCIAENVAGARSPLPPCPQHRRTPEHAPSSARVLLAPGQSAAHRRSLHCLRRRL